MRIYFDSVALIYFVEQIQPWYGRLVSKLSLWQYKGVISDLTRMECRVKPLRRGLSGLLADYQLAFSLSEIVSLNAVVFDRAAEIRAAYNFKTPDAIHLAAAVEANCDALLTNDQK